MLTSTMRSQNPRHVIIAAVITTIFLLFTAFPIDIANDFFELREHPLETEQKLTLSTQDVKSSKSNDYRVLTSTRNTMGLYNTINAEMTGHEIMNPTLLELPHGSKHDFLVIAQTSHVNKVIKGTKYKLAHQVAMFANLTYNDARHPELTAGKWSKLLVQDFAGPEHHCKHRPDMDKYIGAEDMKLFWTRKGAPLLIFTYQIDDKKLCEGIFLIDARAAVPELVKALGDYAEQMPPIKFEQPTGLRRQPPAGHEADPHYQREKNWAPFQSPFSKDDDELFFMVEPSRLFRWTSMDEPMQEIEVEQESVVEAPYPPGVKAEETWHSVERTCVHDVMITDKHVYQSTPILSLTLCDRGICKPHEGNTVLLGMVQRRYNSPDYPYICYDNRIAVYAVRPPYNMMSVSKKLIYHGEQYWKYISTGSMVYFINQTNASYNRNHGFLDDEIWLSFGDSAPGWLDIQARDLVEDHYLCQGVLHRHLLDCCHSPAWS